MSLPTKTIDAWSISRLLEFESCPQRTYLRYVLKSELPEYDDKHPMIRGRRIHEEVEHYIQGATDTYPSSGKKLEDTVNFCREMYTEGKASVEEKWGFTVDWDTTDWFSDSIWLRMATDCYIHPEDNEGIIYDWKTGKSFGNEVKYMQQAQLYAVGAFMRYPALELCDVHFAFLDDGTLRTKSFERGTKINKLIAKFTERANRMTSCVDFRPKPSVMNCKYCPFGPGGTNVCVYGVAL